MLSFLNDSNKIESFHRAELSSRTVTLQNIPCRKICWRSIARLNQLETSAMNVSLLLLSIRNDVKIDILNRLQRSVLIN